MIAGSFLNLVDCLISLEYDPESMTLQPTAAPSNGQLMLNWLMLNWFWLEPGALRATAAIEP
jgi:hypothetical protein